MRLAGKVALISGGARGMGAAEARLFATEGAKVVIGDVLEKEGRQVEAAINEVGGEALFVRLDVTLEEEWEGAVEAAVSRFGKLDVLVNNAGVSGHRRLGDLSRAAWEEIMEVNSTGVYLGCMAAIPAMRKAGGGSIINISSQMGIVGSDVTHPAYHASKGSVRILTKSIAVQYAGEGIRCNSVHPGPIRTPMNEERRKDAGYAAQMNAKVPLGRMGTAEEVACGVLYLASDEASYVTGAELVIDGGWIAQ